MDFTSRSLSIANHLFARTIALMRFTSWFDAETPTLMSALGQEPSFRLGQPNVLFSPKRSFVTGHPNVCFAPKADIQELDLLQCEGSHFRPAIDQQFGILVGFFLAICANSSRSAQHPSGRFPQDKSGYQDHCDRKTFRQHAAFFR